MLEFTGERVIPGLADPNLFNEHIARYRFAARFVRGLSGVPSVLDAGCGSGYGAAEFPEPARVTAIDVSAEAVRHARESFERPGVSFLQAACETLPFADGSFDLIAAFEVIEHLERWPQMLREARRCLKASGVLLVSTPNKAYYAESRADAGPNPFHVREFEYGEFAAALGEVFPHVRLWSQNHVETIAFVPLESRGGALDTAGDKTPEQAHFFLAVCGASPMGDAEAFAWLPHAANILRERERHISLLEDELTRKDAWRKQLEERHSALNAEHEAVLAELRERNGWAERLNLELADAGTRIADLQREIEATHAGYKAQIEQWIGGLELQIADGQAQIARGRIQIENLAAEVSELKIAFEERTRWGESLAAELLRSRAEAERLEAEIAAIRDSRWLRLGRALRVGPSAEK